MSISTGAGAPLDVTKDIMKAEEIGETKLQQFMGQRLSNDDNSQLCHDKLSKSKLKTFSAIKPVKRVVKIKEKETILKADENLFAHVILIAQNHNLHIKDVLCHPRGPIPWALACMDGLPRKTNKVVLGKEVAKGIEPAENIQMPSVSIIDGMSIVQKISGDKKTLAEISALVLLYGLQEGGSSRRIDFVFDLYKERSIKDSERILRGGEKYKV